jgi:hypothetical protein
VVAMIVLGLFPGLVLGLADVSLAHLTDMIRSAAQP